MNTGEPTKPATGDPDELAARAAEGILGPNPFIGLRPVDLLSTARQVAAQAARQPGLALEQLAGLARELISVPFANGNAALPAGDRRFADPAWRDNPLYRVSGQSFLALRRALVEFAERSALDAKSKERANFLVSLVSDALAPTNTLLGNPAALKKIIDSGGANLVTGLRNMLTDLATNGGMPSQVDKRGFRLGENLALSPGAVVFRNDLLELIQYAPSTTDVYARPHLIVPPQVNKYYVFDLAPEKSLVKYLVDNGFQVFMVSWRNPTPAHRNWGMDAYVGALLEAIEAVRDIAGSEDINLHGACSGAMTLTSLLGHLAAKREGLVHAATLMVALLDNTAESQLGLFATPQAIAAAKGKSRVKGVLEGHEMGRVFAWMRPNDLVWNYWVNNYLMGNRPPAFDILYWSNDSTRLAARFHAELLDIFVGNLFTQPGAITVLGTPIDLSQVVCDKYVVAGITDHITPWKGVYNTARVFGGETEFILSSSGHIQSLINPPGNPKAKFYVNPQLPDDAEEWLGDAQNHSGSWWEHWCQWLAARSGDKRRAPEVLGNERYTAGAKAPGSYVFEP